MCPAPGSAAWEAGDPRLPLHSRLRDAVSARIASGEWTPERPLPAETALAEHYGVALGTMRRVLGDLVDQGLLERKQGAGTFVRRAQFDASLFRFFRYGDPEAGAPESRILTARHAALPPEAAQPLGVGGGSEALFLHRLRLREGQPLLVEDIWLPLPRFAALGEMPSDDLGDLLYPAYERHCGVVVASAEEVLTIGAADAAEARVLHCGQGEPLVVVERTARTHDGTPVEWRRSRGRAADFRYRIDIR
ncbi:GntR family transcriptional regulator [Streptomyces lydicus]|uniref:GntR family transcriptional regulator n=1 Tax=Streptomyces lydicus TaxID=47763 RepID=UPI0037B26305